MVSKTHHVLLNIKNELRHIGFANVKIKDNTIHVLFPPEGREFYVRTIKETIDSIARKHGYIQDYHIIGDEYIAELKPVIW